MRERGCQRRGGSTTTPRTAGRAPVLRGLRSLPAQSGGRNGTPARGSGGNVGYSPAVTHPGDAAAAARFVSPVRSTMAHSRRSIRGVSRLSCEPQWYNRTEALCRFAFGEVPLILSQRSRIRLTIGSVG